MIRASTAARHGRTAINITGDAVVTTVMANFVGLLDKDVYRNRDFGAIDEADLEAPERPRRLRRVHRARRSHRSGRAGRAGPIQGHGVPDRGKGRRP